MNIQNLMAQAQKMKRDIEKKQEEIYNQTFVGKSEWVQITMTGKKIVTSTKITFDGDLNDNKEILADMITIATNDAIKQIEKEIESKLGAYSQQLGGLM